MSRILLVTSDLESNSLGRAYVLWMLARYNGWDCQILSTQGDRLWTPVDSPDFRRHCIRATADSPEWWNAFADADLVISVKPVSGSFDVAMEHAHRHGKSLLVDIDDPDLDGILARGRPLRRVVKSILLRRQFQEAAALRRQAVAHPRMVSNPVLARWYGGGAVVPHARTDSGPGRQHESSAPSIVFVGTNRPHKGVDVLREAASSLAESGVTLTVTDVAPSDARPSERWVGTTTLAGGIDLVKDSDIVVIPSIGRNIWSAAQLPVKLMDAMLAARAIVAADLEPLRWATGKDGAVFFRPGEAGDLAQKLAALRDPPTRQIMGDAARRRAIDTFTVDSVAPVFARACLSAMSAPGSRTATVRDGLS